MIPLMVLVSLLDKLNIQIHNNLGSISTKNITKSVSDGSPFILVGALFPISF